MSIQPDQPRFRNPRIAEQESEETLPSEQSSTLVPEPGGRKTRPSILLPKRRRELAEDEPARWSENRQDVLLDQYIEIEQSKASRTGKPIDREEAERRVRLRGIGTTVNPSTGDAYTSTANIKARKPASSRDIEEYIAIQYPTVTAAARLSGISAREAVETNRFLVAHDAASRIAGAASDLRAAQIFNTMGPDLQPVVADIINNWIRQGQRQQGVVAEQSGGNLVTDVGRTVWGYTVGPIADAAWWLNETAVQRVGSTLLNAAADSINDYRNLRVPTYIRDPATIFSFWEQTEKGYIDMAGVEAAKERYGEVAVNTSIDFIQAHRSGEENAIGNVIAKYEDNPEALQVIQFLLTGVEYGDDRPLDAARYIESQERGNFGNAFFWLTMSIMGVDRYSVDGIDASQTIVYPIIRDTANVVGTVILDPTLNAGKVGRAYQTARYGIHKLEGAGNIDKVFRSRSVQNFWNSLGSSLKAVDEAPDAVTAANRLGSVQGIYKKWLTIDGINELRAAKIYTADDALDYFRYGDGMGTMLTGGNPRVNIIVSGQGAKRGRQLVVPHITRATAEFKRASFIARGFTYDAKAAEKIDSIFGAPVSQMLPEEAIPFIVNFLKSTDGEKFLGRMMSDFVFAGDTARRTFMGDFISSVVRISGSDTPRVRAFKQAMLRYGYKRQPGTQARIERFRRTQAHMPSLSAIDLTTGKDAYKIRDLLLYAGVPRYWANYSSMAWQKMNAAQRMQFATGVGRSTGYSLGIDIVDPVNGRRLIDEMMSGFRAGELYAPDAQDLAAIAGEAQRNASVILGASTGMGERYQRAQKALRATQQQRRKMIDSGVSKEDPKILALDEKILELRLGLTTQRRQVWSEEFNRLKEISPVTNPSRVSDEAVDATKGLYEYQMAGQISLLNFNKLDELAMRQSYLTALLGTNPFMTRAVDFWTLGTLAGPRFQVRNAIEDAILYGTTGGSWTNYRYGQLMARAKAEATARPIPRGAIGRAEKEGPLTAADLGPARGMPLGVVPTLTRWLGDRVPKSLNSIILNHLSPNEIAAAAAMGAKGDRAGLTTLIRKALYRQKLIFLSRKKNPQVLRDLDEAAEYGGYWTTYDEASEAAMHLIDGILPGSDDIKTAIIAGNRVQIHTINREYMSREVRTADPTSIRAWFNNLNRLFSGDGIKGVKAASMAQRYYKAKRSGNQEKIDGLVQEFADWIRVNTPWVEQRSGIAAAEGLESFARRNLDDVLNLFTTKTGSFNKELMNKIRRVEVDPKTGKKKFTYKMWDEVDGKQVLRVTEEDLVYMKGKPQSVLDSTGLEIPITDGLPLNIRAWSAMGRSYARLTRQPMFVANYLDARNAIRPLEQRFAAEFGEEFAKKWAVETATERAYHVLMSYVDNPVIRSQMSWNVRNVARFYRALEDFNRRMVRVAKNNPMAFQRINVAWNVMDDTGWVQEDEYGEKYFIWPGSRAAMEAVNSAFNVLGIGGISTPGLPMMFTSNVNMITPSADPDSWWPTLSSPYAAFILRPLMDLVPGLGSLQEEFFGPYSVGTPVWKSIVPTHISRAFEAISTTLITADEETRSQLSEGMYASAARAALQAHMAAGLIDPNKRYTVEELGQIRSRLDITALNITFIRTISAPFIPAAFQIKADTVTDFARSLDLSGMRPAYIQLVKSYDGDYNRALVTFTKMNPGLAIYTVSQNEAGKNIGYYAPFTETVDFIQGAPELFEQYPIGAAFFSPQEGKDNLAAWNYLKGMDVTVPSSVDTYFNKMVTAEGYAMYLKFRGQRADLIEQGMDEAEADAKYEKAMSWAKGTYPNLEDRISGSLKTWNSTSKAEYNDVVNEYRGAIQWMEQNRGLDERGEYAKAAIRIYDEARLRLSEMSENDPNQTKIKNEVREGLRNMQSTMESLYPDDRSFGSLLYALSKSIPGLGV